MPLYTFSHPETGETIDVFQGMNEEHSFVGPDGVRWQREFSKPQAAFNTQIDPTDSKSFVNKTRDKRYSVGDLWDKSQELSDKRGGMSGQDEVRRNAELAYEKKTGKKHPHAKKQETMYV